MTQDHFQIEIGRLGSVFGKQNYVSERAQVIWRETQWLENNDFTWIVDQLIGSCRQPPLIADFSEYASVVRERNWKVEKQRHRQDAEQWSNMPKEEIGVVMHTIRERIRGRVNDQDWGKFMAVLENLDTSKNPSVPALVRA